MNGKAFFRSKTIWAAIIWLTMTTVNYFYGYDFTYMSAEEITALDWSSALSASGAAIMIVLRFLTNKPITLK